MAVAAARSEAEGEQAGLKSNAIGLVDALVIGVASTAPGYCLAASLGLVVVMVGVQAPAALLASFLPMLLVATAYYYLNRVDPDCGHDLLLGDEGLRARGRLARRLGVCMTGILVVGSLADVGARYTYLLFGVDGAAASPPSRRSPSRTSSS